MSGGILVTVAVELASAHSVACVERCSKTHGHTWVVEVTVRKKMNADNITVDFAELKKAVRDLGLDHVNFNEVIGTANATAECIAGYIYGQLGLHPLFGGDLQHVVVRESSTAWVRVGW